jgi:hypothetical protein
MQTRHIRTRRPPIKVPTTRDVHDAELVDEMDAMLDEIDAVLEGQERLASYRQHGGQ